jgi:hypothetical protein
MFGANNPAPQSEKSGAGKAGRHAEEKIIAS